jgi:site-specific DNA-methyltransferase (adenine-specific)
MELMKRTPDKHYELCIVDPPYGIGDKFRGGKNGSLQFNSIVEKKWDVAPDNSYFNELFRVSKNQIIWGGNYFCLPATRCFVVWDKFISEDFSLAMCELAWTSFDAIAKIVRLNNPKGCKIHPTQKPIKLYTSLLSNYAKAGDKILDTHVGSASSLIACHQLGFEVVGCELDREYYDLAVDRIRNTTAQMSLF